MYKDVGKRILAVLMSLCMILGLTDFSVLTVRAAGETAIGDGNVELSGRFFVYNGKEQKPEITVTVGGSTLEADKDYTVNFDANVKDAGTKSVTINGQGSYSGSVTKTYTIAKKGINASDVVASVASQKLVDSATPVIPPLGEGGLTVTFGDLTLEGAYEGGDTTGKDFTYVCSNNIGIRNNASLTITGVNNFSGSKTLNYSILNKNLTEDATVTGIADQYYDGTEGKEYKPSITVTASGGGALTEGVDYEIAYKGDLKKPGIIQVTVEGKGDYENSSVTGQYKIIKDITDNADITIDAIPDQNYTGEKITISDFAIYDKGVLIDKANYTLEYTANKNVGEATVFVVPKDDGCYEGYAYTTFQILPGNLGDSSDVIIQVPDCIYNGAAQTPDPVVTFNGHTMTKGTDYTVSWSNNTQAGAATVTVTGSGNLKGTGKQTFQIKQKSLADTDGTISVVMDPGSFTYDGTSKIPALIVKYTPAGSLKPLTLNVNQDYAVTNVGNNTNAGSVGQASITITGKGNYKDSYTGSFTINAADIGQLKTKNEITVTGLKDYTYTGSAIKQELVLTRKSQSGEVRLLAGRDYTLDYSKSDNVNAGEGKVVTVRGMNNYSGSFDLSFTILPKNISDSAVTCTQENKNASYTYTFNQITPRVELKYLVNTTRITLTSGDYSVNYGLNTECGEDAGTITITGKGNYTGTRIEYFDITKMDLSINKGDFSIPDLQEFYRFDGTAAQPQDFTLWYKYGAGSGAVQMNKDVDYTYTWSSNTVPGTGIITVTAAEDSNFTGSLNIPFYIKGDLEYDATITVSPQKVYTGEPITLKEGDIAVLYQLTNPAQSLKLGTDFLLPADGYSSNTEPGNATVTIKPVGNYYANDTITRNFEIVKKDINNENGDINVAVAAIPDQEYTGSAIIPELAVTYNGATLTKGVDYNVIPNTGTHTNNTVVGDAYITIEGTGSHFTGTREIPFTITKRDISVGDITIEGLDTERFYSGTEVTLGETLNVTYTGKCTDGTDLTLNNDQLQYTISYEVDKNQNGVADNNEVGNATVVLTGTGNNFTGRVEKTFCLKGDLSTYTENTVIQVQAAKTYTGKAQVLGPEEIAVTYFGQKLTYGTDYDIIYVGNVDASENVAFTVKAKGSYYIGEKAGGQDTEGHTDLFSIAKKNIADENVTVAGIRAAGYTYTGESIHPEEDAGFAVVYDPDANTTGDELTLTKGTTSGEGDYRVEVRNAVDVVDMEDASIQDSQKPALVITANENGNYTGSRESIFTINPQSVNIDGTIAKYQITGENPEGTAINETLKISYGGTPITFEDLVVSCNGKLLTASSEDENGAVTENDYTVSYRDNDKVGMAYLVITGHGNYSETKEIPFWITGDLSGEHAQVAAIEPQPYTPGGAKPKVKITYYSKELVEGTDYELSYKNNENVAKNDESNPTPPTVTITGLGGFAGTGTSTTFEIVVRDLTTYHDDMILKGLRPDGYSYTGNEIKPGEIDSLVLKVRDAEGNEYTVDSSQYTISYENNIHGGGPDSENPPYVVITGNYDGGVTPGMNFTGTMRVPFTIVGTPITSKGITISKVADQTFTGSAIEPKVTVTHNGRELEEGTEYTLSWENNTAVGNANGRAGTPAVIVSGVGDYSGEVRVPFTILPRSLETYGSEFKVTVSSPTYTGEALTPSVKVETASGELKNGVDYGITVTNNINAGTQALVTIAGKGNYTGTIKQSFTILPKAIENGKLEITGVTDKVYNTKAQTQTPVVKYGEVTLSASDYSLSYENNVNAGTAAMIVTCKGNYTGTQRENFKISAYELKSGDAAVTVADITAPTYTGSALTPNPAVTWRDATQGISYTLVKDKDYTLSYKNNTSVGTNVATVTIKGNGNFSGSLEKQFSIKGSIALATVSAIPDQAYTGTAIEPKVTVTQGGRTLVEGTDYTLDYNQSDHVNAGKAAIVITGKGSEFGGTKTVYFNIVRDISKSVKVVGLAESYIYTGKSITPSLGKVSVGSDTLVKNRDYKVTLSKNKDVGTATMTITGIGCYKGSESYTFKITRRSIAQCKVSAVADQTYTGKSLKPKVTVKYGSVTLKEGTDYKLVYQNNTSPGRASITINGRGNYNGNKLIRFDIKLAAASGLKAAPSGTTKIKLSWTKKSGVTGYQILNNKNKIVAKVKGSTKTSYTISGLKAGTAYSYKVRTYLIKGGRTYYSTATSLIKTAAKPAAPKISVKSAKSKQAAISWNKISGASGYEIYRSTKSGSGYKKIAATTKTSYTNTKLTGSRKYYFRVRAYKTVNGKKIYSSYSSVKYVTIKK